MENVASEEIHPSFTQARMQLQSEEGSATTPSSESDASTVSVYAEVPLSPPTSDSSTTGETSSISSSVTTQVDQAHSKTSSDSVSPSKTTGQHPIVARRKSIIEPDSDPHSFFAFRDGGNTLANAVKICLPVILQSEEIDGKLVGVWMLTEISHWDVEYERLVFLTDHTLIIVKFDLIQMLVMEYKRLPLKIVDLITYGPLRYPASSILEERNQTGLRIQWNILDPVDLPASQRWNPFSSQVPYVTLIDHPATTAPSLRRASLLNSTFAPPTSLLPSSVTSDQAVIPPQPPAQNSTEGIQKPGSGSAVDCSLLWCRVEDFRDKLMDICPKECRYNAHPMRFEQGEILIENYAGVVSKVINTIQLGFFKSRGRISF
ncbi:hypothetical protein RvY_08670-1 [Ramazzottius varieornatus]|uniref:HSac2 domain-containing protein n=1 Tax=Ramazzottius varieornatus TaxID=947166 RepID=A0A1D1V986_RAMVA|nr:hypothetical protein RvY_08670-1 [Ramazzottius varieornatus]